MTRQSFAGAIPAPVNTIGAQPFGFGGFGAQPMIGGFNGGFVGGFGGFNGFNGFNGHRIHNRAPRRGRNGNHGPDLKSIMAHGGFNTGFGGFGPQPMIGGFGAQPIMGSQMGNFGGYPRRF